jgi:2-amino-4-hydroxy-6-hydroxymethyldihydropteridine diphosphokinase
MSNGGRVNNIIYIALGSNLEDREENLGTAIAAMPPDIIPLVCSPIYETPPWGYIDQPAFLNQVIKAKTDLEPEKLLRYLIELEEKVGRQPTFRYGPRKIDLDILFYNNIVVDMPGLTIPHPRIQERAFVLVPLSDVAPNLTHPILSQTVTEMLGNVDAAGIEWFSAGVCGKMEEK